jgi:anti-anti-sigma regulatory factor
MDEQLSGLPVPAPQEFVELRQALEAAALERVVVDLSTTAFLDALLFGMSRA